jgi:predicted RNA-binding Zn-ribbon protein involved in translation (DUF1610 family)
VHTLLKVLGWVLLVPGGILLLMSPVPFFQDDNGSATAGLIMIGGFFAAPGGLLLRAGITRQRETALQDQMVGFVRAHESFSLEELATHLGKSPAEAQTLLHRDIAKYQLPLIMHRATRRYMRLDRLQRAAQVAERCQSCGGSIDRQILFDGERLSCPYCGSIVVTQAPAQASWQQAQGAWGQQAWAPQQQPTPQQQAYAPPLYQPAQYQPPQQQQPPPNQHQGGPWGHG